MTKLIQLKKDTFHSGKVSVKFSKLYSEKKINELKSLSFDEILKFLEEHDFKKDIDESYLQYKGFYLIEKVLNSHVSNIYKDIFKSASKNNKLLLESYYLKYQIHNLMALIRCKISNETEFEAYLIGDERKKEKFIKAYKMPNIEDSIEYISKKLTLNVTQVQESYKKGIYFLENYLYKEYYTRLTSFNFKFNGIDEKKFFKFIKTYIDLINSRTFLRLKINQDKENIKFNEIIIEGGSLNLQDFIKIENESIKEILEIFNKKFDGIKVCDNEFCISSLDKRINQHKKEINDVFRIAKFGSPFYPLKYLFNVEQEMSKLRILLKSKYLKLSEKEIEELI